MNIRYPHLTKILSASPIAPYSKKHKESSAPLFQFEKEIHNDIQLTHKEVGRYAKDFHRTGYAYSKIPMRAQLFLDNFGNPDWCYMIWDGKSPGHPLHALYFQMGKDMIRIWDRGNILSEYPWKSFEAQADQAGYNIKAFHRGKIEDSRGYWLNTK